MSSSGVPSWAIALIIVIVVLVASVTVYLVFRKRSKTTVGTLEDQDNKELSNIYPIKPLTACLNNSTTTTTTTNDQPRESPFKDDTSSSVWTDEPMQETKISLPLPPPNSSFFCDKMELDSTEANDIYNSYMIEQKQQDYVSIPLDDTYKPFLSTAAATIRSTLKQSIRRKSTTNKSSSVAPLNQFFDGQSTNTSNSSINSPIPKSPAESTRMSRQSSSTSSRFLRSPLPSTPSLPTNIIPPPSPRPDSPLEYFGSRYSSNNVSRKSLPRQESTMEPEEPNSNKIMIDIIPPESSYFSLPVSPVTPLAANATTRTSHIKATTDYSMIDEINQYQVNDDDEEEEESEQHQEEEEEENQEAAASAARKIIRSASRKSRTRSMVVTDEATKAAFSSMADAPSTPQPVAKYATLRGANKVSPEDGKASIRSKAGPTERPGLMDIKKWASSSDSVPTSPSSPSPKRALMSSTLSGSATVSGKRAMKLQQVHNSGGSSDNLLAERSEKSATLGRRSGASAYQAAEKTNTLQSMFDYSSDVSTVEKEPPSARSSLSIVTTGIYGNSNSNNNNSSNISISNSGITETTPSSPVTVESTSPYSSKNNTLRKMGSNVDTIRRMLQSSWSGNNLKESGSNHSLDSSTGDRSSSYMGSVGSSYRPVASPLGSVNPRLQNQHLVSLSLKANTSQAARSRPSMPIGFMNSDILEGPTPTASFSSSTVRTMIPAEEAEADQSKSKVEKRPISGLLNSRQSNSNNNNRSRQPSKLGGGTAGRKQQQQKAGKTPAQKEREKYLKSLEA